MIEPAKELLAEFFTISGFIETMNRLFSDSLEAEIIIPAGCYGKRILFGLRSRS